MFCCCWTECASIGLDPCQLVMSSPMSLLILSLVPGSTECEGRGDHVLTIAVELYFFSFQFTSCFTPVSLSCLGHKIVITY